MTAAAAADAASPPGVPPAATTAVRLANLLLFFGTVWWASALLGGVSLSPWPEPGPGGLLNTDKAREKSVGPANGRHEGRSKLPSYLSSSCIFSSSTGTSSAW